MMEFMVSSSRSSCSSTGTLTWGIETRMGARCNSELARARRMGRESRPFRGFTFTGQGGAG